MRFFWASFNQLRMINGILISLYELHISVKATEYELPKTLIWHNSQISHGIFPL